VIGKRNGINYGKCDFAVQSAFILAFAGLFFVCNGGVAREAHLGCHVAILRAALL